MSYYSMFYIPPCILSFASILYYATKASKGNVAISEFRFGMVLVGWLTKYVLMAILFILIKYADGFDKLRHNKILLV